MSDKQKHDKGRKWQITINNPLEHGLDHETIKEILESMHLDYWCMCDEIGIEKETPHTHIYVYKESNIRFTTIQKKFNSNVHIEWCYGSSKENRDYIRKEGKYQNSEKKETNLIETFEECGELPNDSNKKLEDKILLQKLIDEGYTNEEIIRQFPQFSYRVKDIDQIRYILLYTQYQNVNRENIKVFYIFGTTGTGKSHFVRSLFDAKDIYTISDYEHPFDAYVGQKAIIFDEFRGGIKHGDMLQYLDIYPCQLGARYQNKWACYKYVFVISNIKLGQQYPNIDEASNEALFRRFERGGIIECKKTFDLESKNTIYLKDYYTDYDAYIHKEKSELSKIVEEENDEKQDNLD